MMDRTFEALTACITRSNLTFNETECSASAWRVALESGLSESTTRRQLKLLHASDKIRCDFYGNQFWWRLK